VAEQQGRYLARYLNAEARALEKGDEVQQEPFKYRQLGAMASVGASSLWHWSCSCCPANRLAPFALMVQQQRPSTGLVI
jgi:NADH dehydrogenase FAD-containing subunit